MYSQADQNINKINESKAKEIKKKKMYPTLRGCEELLCLTTSLFDSVARLIQAIFRGRF